MDKGDAFWIRPMKSTLKVEQWYSLLQDHLSVRAMEPRCHCGGLSHGQCSYGKCYA